LTLANICDANAVRRHLLGKASREGFGVLSQAVVVERRDGSSRH
jgi:hypothetical protein